MTRASALGRLRSDLGIFEETGLSISRCAIARIQDQEAAAVQLQPNSRLDSAVLIVTLGSFTHQNQAIRSASQDSILYYLPLQFVGSFQFPYNRLAPYSPAMQRNGGGGLVGRKVFLTLWLTLGRNDERENVESLGGICHFFLFAHKVWWSDLLHCLLNPHGDSTQTTAQFVGFPRPFTQRLASERQLAQLSFLLLGLRIFTGISLRVTPRLSVGRGGAIILRINKPQV
ncbi:hypothetical protein BJX66DRAFT_254736 [Aspergillus keveii]|uniref:Uncharacterized protein n=1 Tax=Aspergillus keveii TaxID=714993 RepID=A0ABR4FYT2_9EURO